MPAFRTGTERGDQTELVMRLGSVPETELRDDFLLSRQKMLGWHMEGGS